MRSTAIIFLTLVFNAFGQDARVLNNSGDPMRVPFACAEDDLAWAGMDCPEDHPCPIYLELSAIAAAGQRLVVSGDLHSASATIGSILLLSSDEGLSWKEPADRIRGAALDQLQFVDSTHGWAAGETQYPLARDPFFLITSDGGSSWRQQPVSEDGGPGSIQAFWFDSLQHGELTIDAGPAAPGGRYSSWETQTGGGSWSMHGTGDKLPKIDAAPTDGAFWRIQPGPDRAVWRIERQTGGQWSSVAAFLVDIAECTIKPGQLKEPDDKDIPKPPPDQPADQPHD